MNYFSKALSTFTPTKFSLKFIAPSMGKNLRDLFLYSSTGKIKRYMRDTVEAEELISHRAMKRVIEDR